MDIRSRRPQQVLAWSIPITIKKLARRVLQYVKFIIMQFIWFVVVNTIINHWLFHINYITRWLYYEYYLLDSLLKQDKKNMENFKAKIQTRWYMLWGDVGKMNVHSVHEVMQFLNVNRWWCNFVVCHYQTIFSWLSPLFRTSSFLLKY